MPGPDRAVEHVLDIRRLDHEGLRLRVDLALVGDEHDVGASLTALVAVGLQRARIAVEVFPRAELQPVHEDAHHRAGRARLGQAHQLYVSLVQIAHRRHEHIVRFALQPLAQRVYRMNHVHRKTCPVIV